MLNTPAIERIAFQKESSLARKLVSLIQITMDELAKTNPNKASDKFIRANAIRIDQVTKYLNRNFNDALITIFKDELNLNLQINLIARICSINAACSVVYKNFSFDKIDVIHPGVDLFSGVTTQDKVVYQKDFFEKQTDDIDLTIGKLKTYSTNLRMILWLYPTSFISNEVFDPKLLPPNTAEEIAAVILHETGHALTFIEHCADMYYRTDVVSNTVVYTNNATDNKEILPIIDKLKKVNTDPELDNVLVSIKDTNAFSIFTPVICIIEIIFGIKNAFTAMLDRFTINGKYFYLNSSTTKTADVVVTQSNKAYWERLADEFVSRHGLGSAIISALAKANQYNDEGHASNFQTNTIKNFSIVQTLMMSFKIFNRCITHPLLVANNHAYDPDWLRFEHILRDALVIFKDPKLDSNIRDYYLQEVQNMQSLISGMKATKSYKVKQFIYGKLLGMFDRKSTLDAIATANLSADYDRLQLITNGLIKNKLYYHAARLQKLIKP